MTKQQRSLIKQLKVMHRRYVAIDGYLSDFNADDFINEALMLEMNITEYRKFLLDNEYCPGEDEVNSHLEEYGKPTIKSILEFHQDNLLILDGWIIEKTERYQNHCEKISDAKKFNKLIEYAKQFKLPSKTI